MVISSSSLSPDSVLRVFVFVLYRPGLAGTAVLFSVCHVSL